MDDEIEELMTPRDEIEDPIYELKSPKLRKRRTLSVEENLHRTLLGLCQDAEDGRFPLFRNVSLLEKTKTSSLQDLIPLSKSWVKALERSRTCQNAGAVYWTKFLVAIPNFLKGEIPTEAEDWGLQMRRWRC
jgi:hypothetical protein